MALEALDFGPALDQARPSFLQSRLDLILGFFFGGKRAFHFHPLVTQVALLGIGTCQLTRQDFGFSLDPRPLFVELAGPMVEADENLLQRVLFLGNGSQFVLSTPELFLDFFLASFLPTELGRVSG